MPSYIFCFFFLALFAAPANSQKSLSPFVFDISQLPNGKDVTLPRPATTLCQLPSRITFTANDTPQSISFKPIHLNGGKPPKILVEIFDRHKLRVQKLNVDAKLPVIYRFHGLSSILVIAKLHPKQKLTGKTSFRLQVESDKPLTIAH